MSLFRNTASLLLVSGFTLPVQFATTILLARLLSVEDRGVYGLAMALSGTLTITAQLGIPSAAIFRIRRMGVPSRRVIATGLATIAAILIVVGVVGWLARETLMVRFLAGAGTPFLVVALCIAMVEVVSLFLRGIARAIDRFDLHNAYTVADGVGILVVVGPVLFFFEGQVFEALLGVLCVRLVATLAIGSAVASNTGFEPAIRGEEVGRLFEYGIKNYLQGLARQLNDRASVLMLAYLLVDASEIALFIVAQGLVRIVNLGPSAIAVSLFPELAGSTDQRAPVLTARVTRHSVFWSIAIAAGAAAVGPFLIPQLYGSEYGRSVMVFLLLLPSAVGITTGQVLSRYFMAVNRQSIVTTVRVLALGMNVGLNFLLIPSHGILGASVATLASASLEAILIVALFLAQTGRGFRETLVVGPADHRPYTSRLAPLLRRLRGG